MRRCWNEARSDFTLEMFNEADVHLLGQAVPLVLLWAAIVEIGFRMQQSFGPLVAP